MSDRRRVNEELRALLERNGGTMTRDEACEVVSIRTLEWAYRAGHVRLVLPGVYANSAVADQPDVLRLAAVRYADGRGALSHTTALDVWGLRPADRNEPVHLSVPSGVRLRSSPPVVVHQRRGLLIEPPHVVNRGGLPVTRLETTLVDAWPMLPPDQRGVPLIRAVNEWRTTPARVSAALAAVPRLPGRAALRTLLERLAAGCHSALEIWGHDHVFTGPGMPAFERQVMIRLDGRTIYLDTFAPVELVNFELDGAASHGASDQRERDLRRDNLLAAHGIQVVRFTHRRLFFEPDAVRCEILDVLAAARRHRAA
jgi:very-short-patch-repair endonuclease